MRGGPSVSSTIATRVPIPSTAKTRRPPRVPVKYSMSLAASRLGMYTKSSCSNTASADLDVLVPPAVLLFAVLELRDPVVQVRARGEQLLSAGSPHVRARLLGKEVVHERPEGCLHRRSAIAARASALECLEPPLQVFRIRSLCPICHRVTSSVVPPSSRVPRTGS